MIDDPQTDFYSTNDTSGDSKDDEDHFKLEKNSLLKVTHEWGEQMHKKQSLWHAPWTAPPLQFTLENITRH